MSDVKRCAACGKENPVSEMKVCMHSQMHNYVCDSKCMTDFYNPPKKPTAAELEAKVATLEADNAYWKEKYRQQVEANILLRAQASAVPDDDEKSQPRIQFGAYGVELTGNQWDQINQAAFELGGTDDGEYCLAPEDLSDLVSQVFVILGFTDEYTENLPSPSATAQVQGDGWIPVSERLPKPNTTVLVFGASQQTMFARHKNREMRPWECLDGDTLREKVTHWMPLPPTPAAQAIAAARQEGKACAESPHPAAT